MIRIGEERTDGRVRVTFELHPSSDAHGGSVVGDFNDWRADVDRFARGDDGLWRATSWLAPGRHRFRYLLEGDRWENDWDADAYEPNDFGGTDSIVDVQHAALGHARNDNGAPTSAPRDLAPATGPQTLDPAQAGFPADDDRGDE
jgi:1,4-alpha-glucan branching enzyme